MLIERLILVKEGLDSYVGRKDDILYLIDKIFNSMEAAKNILSFCFPNYPKYVFFFLTGYETSSQKLHFTKKN